MLMRVGNQSWGKVLGAGLAAVLFAAFLSACGGGDKPFGSERQGSSEQSGEDSNGGDNDAEPGTDPGTEPDGSGSEEEPGVLQTAAIMRGAANYDPTLRVINAAFSVLDADGKVIDGLDGGDFVINHEESNSEGFHDAQRLSYPGQLSGRIHLMLDMSNSMGAYDFTMYKAQAMRLVEEMAAFGLDVFVYTFSHEDPPAPVSVGFVSGGGDPSVVNELIENQQVQAPWNTRLFEIVAAKVEELVSASWNGITYSHSSSPPVLPTAQVELMVLMTDGYDTSGSGSAGDISTAKDNKFNIFSIAIGDEPNVDVLESFSEHVSAPEDGDLVGAVDEAITRIKNYYNGFYVVDYMPSALMGTGDSTYSITLVDNNATRLDITYDKTVIASREPVQPYCCKLRIAPGAPVNNPVSFAAGKSVQLTAVRLWTAEQPDFDWTFTSDGNMSMEKGKSSVVLNANRQSNGTLSVQALGQLGGGWSAGPLNVEAR